MLKWTLEQRAVPSAIPYIPMWHFLASPMDTPPNICSWSHFSPLISDLNIFDKYLLSSVTLQLRYTFIMKLWLENARKGNDILKLFHCFICSWFSTRGIFIKFYLRNLISFAKLNLSFQLTRLPSVWFLSNVTHLKLMFGCQKKGVSMQWLQPGFTWHYRRDHASPNP